MVHAAAATKVIAGHMPMPNILMREIGGVTHNRQVLQESKKIGKHARKIQDALGIEHVVAVGNIKGMKNQNGTFVNFNY